MASAKPVQMNVPKTASMTLGVMTPPKSAPCSDRKRKFNSSGSPVASKAAVYPLFSPTTSPSKVLKSPTSSSPSRKRPNLIIQQGASQINKILRYLQPKRLLSTFDGQNESIPAVSININNNNNIEDKENKSLELKVSLVRLEDGLITGDHSYCITHRSPRKLCCNAASEYVAQALEKIILSDIQDPCRRLGIAVPPCILAESCSHEMVVEISSSHLDNLLLTMMDAGLEAAMIRACCQHLSRKVYPSPTIIHAIFRIMKETSDKKVICLGKSYLKRVIKLFPPCCPHLKKYYLSILHSGDLKHVNNSSDFWSLRFLDFFEEAMNELELHIESLLNPKQLKQKNNIPGIRKIVKPRRFRSSPSPVKRTSRTRHDELDDISPEDTEFFASEMNNCSTEAIKKKQERIEALQSMSNQEKTDHIFSRFEILVDMLELECVLWLSKNAINPKISDRAMCPLVVLALWRPDSDTGFDSVNCRRIFSMYASSWVLKFHPIHLKTLGRLIGLIAEVISASEPNFGNVQPYTGDCCDNLSRKLSDALKNTELAELRAKAVRMLKPDWIQMQVSANLLGIFPSIESADMQTLLEPMTDATMHLWALFLDAVMEFYHTKWAVVLLTQGRRGIFKEELLQRNPVHAHRYEINYKVILKEIVAYSNLYNQLKCDKNLATVLWQVLAL